jgi:predicted Zn-dependent peptidase
MMAAAPADGLRRTVFPNGFRVVTMPRPDSPLAAVKLFVKVGSRYDGAHPGLAHLLEHLLLSNGGSRAAQTAYEAIEGGGGALNAVTTREYTAVQAVVLASQLEHAVNLFADLLEPAAIDPAAVERERGVIRQEILGQNESSQIIWDLFLRALWNGDPFAQPILGTLDSVAAVPVAAVSEQARRYRAGDRMVLAAAGGVNHDEVIRVAAPRFGTVGRGDSFGPEPPPVARPGHALVEREAQQTHLVLGVEGVPMSDPRRSSLRLLEIVLGRGASSRLHRALRTEHGYVYAASAVAMSYADRGYFAVYAASAPENVSAVQGILIDELDRLNRLGINASELARAKLIYEGSLARDFETALSVASIIGIEELLDRLEPFREGVARINAIGVDDVQRVAAEILIPERAAVAAVGRCGPDVRVAGR